MATYWKSNINYKFLNENITGLTKDRLQFEQASIEIPVFLFYESTEKCTRGLDGPHFLVCL